MIPVFIGATFGLVFTSARVLIVSSSAGMGYGLGKKYGRKACELLDHFDTKVKTAINNISTE